MIQNDIQFTINNEDYVIINKKISRDSATKINNGKNNPIINAVSIDWNNAKIDDNTYINTTGELLSLIKKLIPKQQNILTDEQLEALNYIVEFVKQIKGKQQIINENDYFIYIGVDKPDENTDPLKDLININKPLYDNTSPMGWRSIGQDLSIYNVNNKAYDGGINPVILNSDFDDINGYIVVPVELNIYDGLGNIVNWIPEQTNVTIREHQYNIYYRTFGGEFVLNIY